MIGRYFAIIAVAVAVLIGLSSIAGTAQDNYEERIENLEDRVAALETAAAATPIEELEPVATDVAGEEETFTIEGTFQLSGTRGDEFTKIGDECYGLGGYDDFGVGAKVTIRDGADEVIATSQLEADETATRNQCRFTFEVDVPETDFYAVYVGAERRGSLTFSFEEMEEANWRVELSIG